MSDLIFVFIMQYSRRVILSECMGQRQVDFYLYPQSIMKTLKKSDTDNSL